MWLPLAEAQALAQEGRRLPHTQEEYERVLRAPLYALDMSYTFETMPEVKQYLLKRWQAMWAAHPSAPPAP